MKWLLYYLSAINIIGVVIMGWDKIKARAGVWRIPENNLLLIALTGGSAGIYLGLRLFHHKTRHFKFTVIVPIVLLIQLIIIGWLFYNKLF